MGNIASFFLLANYFSGIIQDFYKKHCVALFPGAVSYDGRSAVGKMYIKKLRQLCSDGVFTRLVSLQIRQCR